MSDEATPRPWRWADWSPTFGNREDPNEMRWLEHNPTHGANAAPQIRTRTDGSRGVLCLVDPIENEADRAFILKACNEHDELHAKVQRYEVALRRIAQWDGDPSDTNAALNLVDIADAALVGVQR